MIPTVCVLAAMNYGLMTQCQYVPMPDRYVGLYTAEALVVGKLTADGKFTTTVQYVAQDGVILIISGPMFTDLNGPDVVARPVVYHLDGKTLTPGRVTRDGTFTEDPKGKAIPFAEYVYSPTAPPIWNLPGRFLPLGIDPDKRPPGPPKASGGGFGQSPKLGGFGGNPRGPTWGGFGGNPPGVTWGGFGGPGWSPPASVQGGGGSRPSPKR